MKYYLIALMTAIGIFSGTITEATPKEGPYVSVLSGMNYFDCGKINTLFTPCVSTESSLGYVIGGALGYKFHSPLRIEGEISYRHNSIGRVKLEEKKIPVNLNINTFSYMMNGYYDHEICWPITPYLGLGIGYVHSEGNFKLFNGKVNASADGLAAQFMVGALYELNSNTDIGLEYRFRQEFRILCDRENSLDHALLLTLKRYF